MPDGNKFGRRQFLNWSSAVGLGAILPAAVSDVAAALDRKEGERTDTPDSVPADRRGDPSESAQLTHPLESELTRKRYEESPADADDADPEPFIHPVLKETLENTSADDTVNITVTTVGRENSVETKGTYRRSVHGWCCSEAERGRLAQYGSIEHAFDFLAPKVTMRGVSPEDVKKIASLPFTLRVNYDPDIAPAIEDAGNLRGADYFDFENTSYNVDSNIRIGILDSGYEGGGAGSWNESHAELIGIDGNLAADFTPDDDWTDDTNTVSPYHGDNVANTAAYMLDPSHQTNGDLFVPLKFANDSGWWGYRARQAIEYAAEHDIDVINLSFGSTTTYNECPDQYCEELLGYTDLGYIPVAATGNDASTDGVNNTATSKYSIGCGGIYSEYDGEQDYKRHSSSNYGTVHYGGGHGPSSWVYCDTCFTGGRADFRFKPDVYAQYGINDPDGGSVGGTSNATPCAVAAAAIMQSNGLYNYSEARNIFSNMDTHTVGPDDAADAGHLLDVHDAHHKTV